MHRSLVFALILLVPLSLLFSGTSEAKDLTEAQVEQIVRLTKEIRNDLVAGHKAKSDAGRAGAAAKVRKGFETIQGLLTGVDDPGAAEVRSAINSRVLEARTFDISRFHLRWFIDRLKAWERVSSGTWGRVSSSAWSRITGASWNRISGAGWDRI